MATQKQIEANRKNAQKSTGPKSPDGKDVTKFNGLKHGLRAEHVVLPGEDKAALEAELKGWADDWNPQSQARAALVERAASASWRLRRCVRAEAARLGKRAAAAVNAFDGARSRLIGGSMERLHDDPAWALHRLRSDAAGLDHLIGLWDELAEAVADPSGWQLIDAHHDRFLALLGYPTDAAMDGSEPALLHSYYLLLSNTPGADFGAQEPLDEEDREDYAAAVLEVVERERAALVAERSRHRDPALQRSWAIDLASVDTSKEAVLEHRYEMAHDRSLRATINQLAALQKSGADLAERAAEAVAPTEPNSVTQVSDGNDVADEVTSLESPPKQAEGGPEGPSEGPPKADRDRDGRVWPVEGAISGPPAAPEGR